MKYGCSVGLALLVGCAADAEDAAGNHAPVVHPTSARLREDSRTTFTLHAEDADGDDLQVWINAEPGGDYDFDAIRMTTENGVALLGATVTLMGYPDFHGEVQLPVFVSDGIERTRALVDITVEPVNDKPTARPDGFATAMDTELVLDAATLLANDDDAADVADDAPLYTGLSLASVGAAPHGTVSLVAGKVSFVPTPGFAGAASFTYQLTDGEATAEATVDVLVGGSNAVPAVVEDATSTPEGVPLVLDVAQLLVNDRDDDGHTLVVIGVANAEHGTVELRGRTITFTPMGENGQTFFGTAGFDYTVTDGASTSTGHVIVEVWPWL
ncbi:MAG: Ig-like domain-containing protein [Kofleriaceae bacterium]|nr:Ig-like domain-containing protein [Kofleriaceae bacterium]